MDREHPVLQTENHQPDLRGAKVECEVSCKDVFQVQVASPRSETKPKELL